MEANHSKVFRLRHWASDGPPTTVEFEQIEQGRIEYRLIERDLFTNQSAVTYRELMTVEEARKQWRALVDRVGYKRVA
jgi:hypothetical protein